MIELNKSLDQVNILVVGDIMLDKFRIGTVNRICPEAPIPIVELKREYSTLGGCGNVANNIASLGAKATVISQYGDDSAADEITSHLKDNNIKYTLFNSGKPTIIKERIISTHRDVQMLRVDTEEYSQFKMKRLNNSSINDETYDVIIISDYGKGMISRDVIKYFRNRFNKFIILDPKPCNIFEYNNLDIDLITPNEIEYNQMDIDDYFKSNFKHVLQTKGKQGMILDEIINIRSHPIEIYNVSGAGDTVVAILGICISLGLSLIESAKVANECARYVVSQPGTSVVPLNIFNDSYNKVMREI